MRRWFVLVLSVVLATFSLVSAACQRESVERITLSDTEDEASSIAYRPDTHVVRMAVAPVLSPRTTLDTYQELINYMAQRLGRQVELVQGKTYGGINNLVKSGDVAVALVCSGAFVAGQEDFGMEALVVPVVDGETIYYSYLIVPKGSPAEGLRDLRGKTFAFTDPLSNSGRLVPLFELWRIGERPETFFERFIFTYSHDNSIKAVAGGLVDGAAVDSLVYDYLAAQGHEYVAKTKVIWRSPPYGINPVVVNSALDPQLKSQLRDLFLTMHEDEEGRRILDDLLIDRFVLPEEGAYDSIRDMQRAVFGRGE